MQQEDRSSEEELFFYSNPKLNKDSEQGDDVTVVTVHGRVISRVKSRARILRSGILVVVGGTRTVSGSRRTIPDTYSN